jgi:hypothetical protein
VKFSKVKRGIERNLPCPEHSQANWGSQWQSRRKEDRSRGMREGEGDRIPLDQRCPREPIPMSSRWLRALDK